MKIIFKERLKHIGFQECLGFISYILTIGSIDSSDTYILVKFYQFQENFYWFPIYMDSLTLSVVGFNLTYSNRICVVYIKVNE